MPDQPESTPDFESALRELEALVDKMERGELSLEQSLALFERGVNLTRVCQEALAGAQLKVERLLEAEPDAREPEEPDSD